jgi:hypothetical protein
MWWSLCRIWQKSNGWLIHLYNISWNHPVSLNFPFKQECNRIASVYNCLMLIWCWYIDVTVLLPGWVIWKYWNCPCKFFSLSSGLASSLLTPNWEGYNSLTDLNPNTITSVQLLWIQFASLIYPTKPQANPNRNIVSFINLLINLHTVPIYEKNIQKEFHWPPNISKEILWCSVAETEERCTRDITRDILGVRRRPDPVLSAMHSGKHITAHRRFSVLRIRIRDLVPFWPPFWDW